MKRPMLIFTTVLTVSVLFSCTGVKKVSGTLTKSGSTGHRDYSNTAPADYSKVTATSSIKDTVRIGEPVGNGVVRKDLEPGGPGDGYRKDYGRLAGVPSNATQASAAVSLNPDVKDKLLSQYADMDRLADLVLYELNIVERRWDQLLLKFKMASVAEREKISADLDQLSADQLRLFRAHVKIYKEGRADWEKTKKDVESTLFAVRGVGSK